MNSGGSDGTWAASSGTLACSGVTTTLSGHSGVPDVAQGSILLIDKAALQTVWLDCTATLSSGCDNAGLVFAYVDHLNFWVRIYSKAQQKILDYQVVNGAWTQKNSSNTTITAGVAFGMATQVRAGQAGWISGTCPAGQVGLWASHGTANSFDNFKVRDRAGPYEVDGKWFADVGDVRVDNADNNVLETFGSDYQERCVVRRGFRGEKFVATFKFKWNGSSSTSPGFVVRWLNPGDWVAVYVKSSDGKARVDRRKDDGVVTNLATSATGLSLTSGTWYTAKAVVDDDTGNSALQRMRFWVDTDNDGLFSDETTLLDSTAVDDDFSAGYCGLFRSNLYADVQQVDDFKLGIDNSSPKDGDFDDAGDEIVIDDTFNSTTTNLSYDDNGNLTDDGVFKYVYDAWNRLVKVTWRIKSSPSTVATYAYDGRYRRISKTITNSGVEYWPNDGGSTTLHFYYDRSAFLIEARNGSDRTLAQYGREVDCNLGKTLFVDINGDATGNDADPDTTSGGESAYADKRYYFHFDRGQRVVALTEYVPSGGSGVAGRVVERYAVGLWAESMRGDSGSGELGSSAGQRVGWQPQSSGRGGLGGVPCEPHGGHRSVAGRKQSGHCIPAPNIDCWPVPDPWPNPWPSPAPEPIPGPLPTPIPMGPCFNPCPDPGPVPGPSPTPTPGPTPGPVGNTCTVRFTWYSILPGKHHVGLEFDGGTLDYGPGGASCILTLGICCDNIRDPKYHGGSQVGSASTVSTTCCDCLRDSPHKCNPGLPCNYQLPGIWPYTNSNSASHAAVNRCATRCQGLVVPSEITDRSAPGWDNSNCGW